MFSIVVIEGDQLQEVARPVSTQQILIVAQELARLTRQAEKLQKHLDALQQQVAELKK